MEDRSTSDRIEQTGLIASVAFMGLFIFSLVAVASAFFTF